MALSGQIINFCRLNLPQQTSQGAAIAQIAIMQLQRCPSQVRVGIDMIEAGSVKSAGPADESMHFIPLAQQKFRQIRTILACDSGDERCFWHNFSLD